MAKSHLGLTKWQLGEVDRAHELVNLAHRARIANLVMSHL